MPYKPVAPTVRQVHQEACGETSPEFLENLTARMPKVCKAVSAAHGGFFEQKVGRIEPLFKIEMVCNIAGVLVVFVY